MTNTSCQHSGSEASSELLPCPFCGETRIFLNKPNEYHRHGSINCPACLLVLPGAVKDERELINTWNQRAALAPAQRTNTEALQLIAARLADLREANDVLRTHSWDRTSEIQRNNREIGWLIDLNTLLRVSSPAKVAPDHSVMYDNAVRAKETYRRAAHQNGAAANQLRIERDAALHHVERLTAALKSLRGCVKEGGMPRYTVTPGAALNSIIEEVVDPALAALTPQVPA